MKRTDIDFKKIPDAPGVYFFLGRKKEILYVGKATSLRDRVKSYFAKDIAEIRSPLVAKIVADAVSVKVEETDSVLEALILEAKYIKKYTPIGNTEQKDNKSWNYLVITDEAYPRVLVARERELSTRFSHKNIRELFGPFPNGGQLKEALKIIRRIFPFFDSSFSITEQLTPGQKKTFRFNQSLGLYPKELDGKEYQKTIHAISDLFSGKKTILLKRLERDMHAHARRHEFEKAAVLKRQLFALKHIRDVTLIKEDLKIPETSSFRIEAYDVAHLRGAETRGVMTVVENGEKQTSLYRLFTVRGAKAGDDLAALQEILTRRAKHHEWRMPQLIVIDGGKTHLNYAKRIIEHLGISAEVVAVVKDEKHRPRQILGSPKVAVVHESEILLANSEAHRFAISKHRKALRNGFL